MKLEVGMYIRTKQGSIAKVLGIDIFEEGKGTDISNLEAVYFDTIVNNIDKDIYRGCFNDIFKDAKASHNIIDLIEVGDYVNGHKVILVNTTFTYASVNVETSGEATCEIIPLKNIKSILTKEQFEREAYKI